MGTRSLTYIYDESQKVIIKMYLQFDGYPSGLGRDLAKFLKNYYDENQDKIEMEKLSGNLVSYFFLKQGDYAMLISPFCTYYCCQEWEYHIYSDKVRIEGDDIEFEADWRNDDFEEFCKNSE